MSKLEEWSTKDLLAAVSHAGLDSSCIEKADLISLLEANPEVLIDLSHERERQQRAEQFREDETKMKRNGDSNAVDGSLCQSSSTASTASTAASSTWTDTFNWASTNVIERDTTLPSAGQILPFL